MPQPPLCVGYETKNIAQDEYELHQTFKNEARKELEVDKSSEHVVFSMDLQSVLLSPKSSVSNLYYKMKLAVHNFTLYNNKDNKGFCFLWNESEGNLTANEFSTIIVRFITNFLETSPTPPKTIIMYMMGVTIRIETVFWQIVYSTWHLKKILK